VKISVEFEIYTPRRDHILALTLNLLTSTIVALPSNAIKWQMGFNSAFQVLNTLPFLRIIESAV
jgi:hypothetical protein